MCHACELGMVAQRTSYYLAFFVSRTREATMTLFLGVEWVGGTWSHSYKSPPRPTRAAPISKSHVWLVAPGGVVCSTNKNNNYAWFKWLRARSKCIMWSKPYEIMHDDFGSSDARVTQIAPFTHKLNGDYKGFSALASLQPNKARSWPREHNTFHIVLPTQFPFGEGFETTNYPRSVWSKNICFHPKIA